MKKLLCAIILIVCLLTMGCSDEIIYTGVLVGVEYSFNNGLVSVDKTIVKFKDTSFVLPFTYSGLQIGKQYVVYRDCNNFGMLRVKGKNEES